MITLESCHRLVISSLKKIPSIKLFSTTNTHGTQPNAYKSKQAIDSQQVMEQKVNSLAQMILSSKHPIFFTGAGISTSLGIPDYRSGSDTIIKTGPGLWNRPMQQVKVIQQKRNTLIDQLIPSLTHMAIKTLVSVNVFKHVVSQNTDGLHLRSGIDKNHLSELHGNRNLEYCIKCQRKYLRDFRTIRKTDKDLKPGQKRDHVTGRKCQNCSGDLHDSIVYFGEKLPREQLVKGYEQGAKSDLCLAMGSSLTVKPSANIPLLPLQYQKEGKLAIINVQQTSLDVHSSLKMNGFCDQIMCKLMQKLRIPIMEYQVERYLEITVHKQYNCWVLKINGVDAQHYNFSYIKNVSVVLGKCPQRDGIEDREETTILELRNMFEFELSSHEHDSLDQINIKVEFFGPFPDLSLNMKHVFDCSDIIGHESRILKLTSTNNKHWNVFKTN